VNGRRNDLYAVGDLRIWRITLAAPCPLWSANDAHRASKYATADIRKKWRTLTFNTLTALKLPTGLARVSFDLAFHPVIDNRRDALNYADTAKPIIDAFGPPFIQKPTTKKPGGAFAPGYNLIPDDTPQYVEDNTLAFGDLWQDVITRPGWPLTLADVHALDNKWGGVTIVVSERPPLPPAPARKRIPLKDVIPADVRRRLNLAALRGD
jgi:hypothetical protein